MKSIFNSHNILLKALLALALCLVSGSAWGGSDYYAKVRIQVSPTGAGSIYADSGSDNSALNSDNTEVTAYHNYNSGTKYVTIKIGATPKTGYSFNQLTGWNYSPDSDAQAEGTNNGDGTYTIKGVSSTTDDKSPTDFGIVTATFSAISYMISLNLNGGTFEGGSTTPIEYNYDIEGGTGDEKISKLPKVVRTGYDFSDWSVAVTTQGESHGWGDTADENASVKKHWGNVTLTAQWTPVNYQIDLNLDGGTLSGGATETTYHYNIEGNGEGNISNLPKVEKTGYSFNGWSIAATTQGESHGWGNTADENASVKEHWGNVTLTAQWTLNYTIKYYDGETEQTELEPKSYTMESDDALPSMTKDGYTFVGWKPIEDVGSWKNTDTYPAGTELRDKYGDVRLVAQWTPTSYEVTLNPNDGTLTGTSETKFSYNIEGTTDEGKINKLPKVERTGYSFAGWEVTSTDKYGWRDHSPGAGDNGMSVEGKWGDVELTALWEPIPGYIKITVSGLMKNDSAVFEISYGDQPVVVSLNSSNAGGLVVKIPDVGAEGKKVTVTPKSWPKNYKEVSTSPVEKTVLISHDIDNSLLYDFHVGERTSNIFETFREL